jgi:hypothetical protein
MEQPDNQELHRERRKRLRTWSVIAPLAAFLAGPATVTLFWELEVYVFDGASYVTSYERIEELTRGMPVGLFVGLIASVAVALRILLSSG